MTAVVVSLPGSDDTAAALAAQLRLPVARLESRRFPDGESYLRLHSDVQGLHAVVVAVMREPDPPALNLWFVADLLRELGARRVGLVTPYLPYMRQDIRFHPGEAVTSRTYARFVSSAFDWLAAVDPHLHRFRSLDEIYTIPSTVVCSAPAIAHWVRANVADPVLVGPDSESEQWVAGVAQLVGCPWMVLSKLRHGDRDVEISTPQAGAHAGRTPVLIDDIVSSGKTMAVGVQQVRQAFAQPPLCVAVHAVFADGAVQLLREAGAARVVSCNTLPHDTNAIDVLPAVADAVRGYLA